ncbi:MAG: hypothetical protein IOC82_06045 [Aestuariivirga sp.]|uniref:hypothetical protein n=1 Tax=Aestuariivirga sp. TaxID=2650926 RepID=UPI0025C502D3|nr:hypothetical protein [Aestuariivirga sp.]MCA3560576.1 hypothetical protein [Aestuariivirga sp.]
MATCVHWVLDGRIVPPPPQAEGDPVIDERDLLQRTGFVKMTGSEQGTSIRWSMFSRNWASLYFAAEWLQGAFGPYQLQYYSAGWFNERHEQPWSAAGRIHHLIHKSDVHLSKTVYIHKAAGCGCRTPPLLQKAIRDNAASEDVSIDCAYDPSSQRYRVARVGPQSTIAKLWGLNPVSYPCLIGHSYDEAVSQAYPKVTRTGEPHYDHIYAAMASARGDVVWVPYQRVVLPLVQGRNKKGVRVVTELAEVDISPL